MCSVKDVKFWEFSDESSKVVKFFLGANTSQMKPTTEQLQNL